MLGRMAAELNDTALMLRYKDGDVAAFDTLYARHRLPLFRYLMRRVGNQQLAEDVFQEVWRRIISNRSNYRPSAQFVAYLYHIARNCTADHFRRAGKSQATLSAAQEELTDIERPDEPVQSAMQRDTRQTLLGALAELPEEQRETFLLRQESELSLDEIATITGVGIETVRSRLRYAISKLRKHIQATDLAAEGS